MRQELIAMEERYVSAVDKALKNFEYSTEWADLISALGKLNKVLSSNSKYGVIPRRIKISKRLAQCMHPALPFGVHLKALETYDIIFKAIGPNRLSHQLFIYSAGLFPLFSHAAMKVRPFLLDIYENHFVPLGSKLRPALPGLLNSLLMGLEETADHFLRTARLLDRVCEDVGALEFYGCLWDCLAANSAVRQAAVSFVLSHFDKRLPAEDQPHMLGTDLETVVVGLTSCVADSNVLVQRSALDLLQAAFPMHNSHMTRDDMVRLVTASLAVLLRRDMSLNRRLYGWLLGSEINLMTLSHYPLMRKAISENSSTSYFDVFSKSMLVEAINTVLDNAIGKSPHDLTPYKLLRTLMDKREIGSVIINDLLFQVFRVVYLSHQCKCDNTGDLVKCINVLVSSVKEPRVWVYLGSLVRKAVVSKAPSHTSEEDHPVTRVSSKLPPSLTEICAVSELLVDLLVDDPSAPTDLPGLFLAVINEVGTSLINLSAHQVARALALCSRLLARMQPSTSANDDVANILLSCLERYKEVYVNLVLWIRKQDGMEYQLPALSNLLKSNQLILNSSTSVCATSAWILPLELSSKLLIDLSTLQTCQQSQSRNSSPDGCKSNEIPDWLIALASSCCCLQSSEQIRIISVRTILTLVDLCRTAESLAKSPGPETGATNVTITPLLTSSYLCFLSSNTQVFQVITDWLWSRVERSVDVVTSVERLHQMHSALPDTVDKRLENYLAKSAVTGDHRRTLATFARLWHVGREFHSKLGTTIKVTDIFCKCMVVMLEQLASSENDLVRLEAEEWLVQSLLHGDIYRLLDPLLVMLLDQSTSRLSIHHVALASADSNDTLDTITNDGLLRTNSLKMKIGRLSGDFDEDYWLAAPTESLTSGVTSRSCGQLEAAGSKSGVASIAAALFTTKVSDGENEPPSGDLVRSWSFPAKVNHIPGGEVGSTLEESTPAEDYFCGDSPNTVVEDILADLLDRVTILSGDVEDSGKSLSLIVQKELHYNSSTFVPSGSIEQLHSHILLYIQAYDAGHVLYTLRTLRGILNASPSTFLCAAATTPLVSRSSILSLLGGHRKSLFGRGFAGNDSIPMKSSMYLEVILLTCLFYLRSFYPPGLPGVTDSHIEVNCQVRVVCCELVSGLVRELISLVRSSGVGLANYLADLFFRLKVHRVILHTALTALRYKDFGGRSGEGDNFASAVLTFNDSGPRHVHSLHIQLARLLLSLIILEYEVNNKTHDEHTVERSHDAPGLKYVMGRPIPQQPLFLATVSRALESEGWLRSTQVQWTTLVTNCLEYLGSATTSVASTVIARLCRNIEHAASACYADSQDDSWPPDYVVNQLEALTFLCHYCLLDSASQQSSAQQSSPAQPTQLLTSIAGLFLTTSSPSNKSESKDKGDWHISAKKAVLGYLPRIISSVSLLWQALVNRKDKEGENCVVGSPRVVRQLVLDLLSPIAKHHSVGFLAAMAVVWRERRPTPSTPLQNIQQSLVTPGKNVTDEQAVLVQLLLGIKALPMDTLVQTIHQVVKQPASSEEVGVEVSALELLLQCLSQTGSQVADSWPKLAALLRDQALFSPSAQFLLLAILDHFVHRCPVLTERRDIRDLQDITAKLIEGLTSVAGASLEQTTWLRRNLAVREEEPPQSLPSDTLDKYVDTDGEPLENENLLQEDSPASITAVSPPDTTSKKKLRKSKLKRVTKKFRSPDAQIHMWFIKVFVNEQLSFDSELKKTGGGSTAGYSAAALSVMGQLLAPMLDVVFGSQEKERVVTLVTNLMYNVTPYLKNHTSWNGNSFYACSQLLASLTGYQYTRKAWKKDAMELLLDPSFFQMEPRAVPFWRTVIDNLVSQDTATFRELIGRVAMSQGNGLNLFSAREQEYEQKAALLKRLAFVIYCSEKDQFHKHMPDIQELVRLQVVVPVVQAAVMLCFRVLLLRMSPHHVVPLWPSIVSEMVQVLLHMELSLSTDSEEFSQQIGASMEWGVPGNNLQHLLQLQLATAHLLFLCVQLPPDLLPQFAMYRWAFVGTGEKMTNALADYVPHVTRISRLMDAKYGCVEAVPVPLLPATVRSLSELHPFFSAMSSGRYTQLTLSQIEHYIELDFLDSMPTK